jgi:hypothetical protein
MPRDCDQEAVMGHICPYCGEGLPEDELCPCMAGPDDDENETQGVIYRSLTGELDDIRSPVRQFLGERFSSGLREVQRRYREDAPARVIPRNEANPGTVGTAAEWLFRFLAHPQPDMRLALLGSSFVPQHLPGLALGVLDLSAALGLPEITSFSPPPGDPVTFTGPVPGSTVEPELLARGCWALALLTEFYRAGPARAANSPLAQLPHAAAPDLLALATPAALDQLAQFRQVFETTLMPQLAAWNGPWTLGPTFAGSALLAADADLIAAGLLLEVKTSAKKLSLSVLDLLQVIGYALLDFDDEYRLRAAAIFSARYAYLIVWELGALLDELAGHGISLPQVRGDFRETLQAHQSRKRSPVRMISDRPRRAAPRTAPRP